MLNPTEVPGVSTCDEHPAERFATEQEAARHLHDHHPKLWDLLNTVEVELVSGRANRRKADRAARRSQAARRRRR